MKMLMKKILLPIKMFAKQSKPYSQVGKSVAKDKQIYT